MTARRRAADALLAVGAVVAATAPLAAQGWERWGGPDGDFSVTAGALAESWPQGGPPVVWRRGLGAGYSSIVHRDGVLFTAYRDGDQEVVVAISASSGETLWEGRSRPEPWPEMDRQWGLGPNATPLLIDDRLLAVDIGGRLRAFDAASGAARWERSLPADFGRLPRPEEYGYSSSPLPYRETAIVLAGGDRHAVVALDPADGSVVWGSAPGATTYGPPALVTLAGRDHFVYFEPAGVVALDPASGAELWRSPIGGYPETHNGSHLTPPVRCDDRHLWIGSQWPTGGGRLLEVTDDGSRLRAEVVWQEPRAQTAQWTVVRVGDTLYGSLGSNRTSSFSAVAWRTGEILWRERGFHKAQVLRLRSADESTDQRLLFVTEAGDLVLARVSRAGLSVLARATVVDGKAWTIPTLVGETLYLRDERSLVALDLGAAAPDPQP